MLRIRNILYPTDFSPGAEAALPHALHYARRYKATLHMMHVAPVFGDDPLRGAFESLVDDDAFYRRLRDAAEKQMEALVEAYHARDVDIKRVHARGSAPGPVLLDYAASEDIDLIVMGTHGRRGLRHMLLGSVTEEVMRQAICPVLTVRAPRGERPATPVIRRLLVPVDFSTHSENAFRYAAEVAALYEASLDLLHVLDLGTHPEFYVVSLAERGSVLRNLEVESRREMERLVSENKGPSVVASLHVAVGSAPEAIIAFAEAHDTGMIVIASHGRTGIERFPMGSVAERVVRGAPCPVFIVRPFGKSLIQSFDEGALEERQAL